MRKSIVEEWRDIPKYCGLYQAGNSGYIRSVTRVTVQYNNTYGSRNLKASLTDSIIQLNNSKSDNKEG